MYTLIAIEVAASNKKAQSGTYPKRFWRKERRKSFKSKYYLGCLFPPILEALIASKFYQAWIFEVWNTINLKCQE